MNLTDLIPAHRLLDMQAGHDRAMAAKLRGTALALDFDRLAGDSTVAAARLRRLRSTDRHARAIARAELAGITGIRDALTANA